MFEISYEQAMTVLDLPSGEGRGGWSSAVCPAHDDTNPSLRIARGDSGNIAAKCHKGCDYGQIMEAIEGFLGSDAPKRSRKGVSKKAPAPPKGKHVASYTYTSVDGLPMAVKKRYQLGEEKTFIWCDPQDTDKHGLPNNMTEANLPLYNVEDVVSLDKKRVVWVEGEKAADALKETYGVVAICLPGGSSANPTDDQMEPLRGRKVILWPDNDEPGRTLMRTVADRLAGMAKKVWTIMPYVPPGGDAYNYVKAGHTKEQLREEINAVPQEASMDEIADGYEVTIPDTGGIVKFRFLDVENNPREINADVEVWREMTGSGRLTYSARQNLQSVTGRATFIRQLSQHFGPDNKDSSKMWSRIVDTAYGKVQESQRNRQPDEWILSPTAKKSSLYLMSPLVVDDGLTIPFGMGASGKSYMALLLAVLTAVDKPGLEKELGLSTKRHGPVLYVDYEASIARAQRRVRGIVRGLGLKDEDYDTEEKLPIHYWPGGGLPMIKLVYPLRKRFVELDAALLVVDSVSRACGVDLNSQETVSSYSNAIARIGATASINIAHVTKDAGKAYPFGSVFWHNDPRLTWNVRGSSIEDNKMGLIMYNRKSNDDRLHEDMGYVFEFSGSDKEDDFSVEIITESTTTLEGKIRTEGGNGNGRHRQIDKVLEALDEEPLTNRKLKHMFPEFENNIDSLVAQLKKASKIEKSDDGTWETTQ